MRTISVDEMTGIQALERAAPSLPMKPGHVERREFEYVRHGTQALIAAFDVATGAVCGVVGDSRTEADYVALLENLFASAATTATWHVVCDNLNTHISEGVVRLVERCRGRSGRERQVGRARLDENPRGVPARCEPPHRLSFHTEARILA